MLTGECKEAFEKWLSALRKHPTDRKFSDIDRILHHQGYDFNDWTFSMQWGVYLEFFDDEGIYMNTPRKGWDAEDFQGTFWYKIKTNTIDFEIEVDSFDTRPEAQAAAISKASAILEERFSK